MKLEMKKYSIFQIVSAVLIALLVIGIIVQIGLMIHLKLKKDDLQDKNDNLSQLPEEETSLLFWQQQYLQKIEKEAA